MQNVSTCVRSHAFDVVERKKKGGTCGGSRRRQSEERFTRGKVREGGGKGHERGRCVGDEVRMCSCNSNETYENCCKRVHENGITRETTPEMIVRARFTSYKENKPEFIVESTHEESPDFTKRDEQDAVNARRTLESDAKATAKKIRFLSLKIMKKGSNGENESGGEEAFVSYECAFDAGRRGRRNRGPRRKRSPSERGIERIKMGSGSTWTRCN